MVGPRMFPTIPPQITLFIPNKMHRWSWEGLVFGVTLVGSEVLVRECQFTFNALVVGSNVEAGSVPDLLLTFGL